MEIIRFVWNVLVVNVFVCRMSLLRQNENGKKRNVCLCVVCWRCDGKRNEESDFQRTDYLIVQSLFTASIYTAMLLFLNIYCTKHTLA